MDLNSRISRSFDNRRSTIFDSTLEQASISIKNLRPKQVPLNINRQPIIMRSSRTFASTVFKPPQDLIPRFNMYKPKDHSSEDFFGSSGTNFSETLTHKDQISKFEPKYSYEPVWKIEDNKFLSTTPEPKIEKLDTSLSNIEEPPMRPKSTIKAIKKRSCASPLNNSFSCLGTASDSPKALPKSKEFTSTLRNNEIYAKPTKVPEQIRSATPQPISRSISPIPSSNHCLQISGLQTTDSDYTLRSLCKGLHIVSLSTNHNNFTGNCSGTAELTLKSSDSDLSKLKKTLFSKGYSISESTRTNGKKNNYAELANQSFLNSFIQAKSNKSPLRKHHMESSDDVFGSSPGVGRYYCAKKIPDKQSLVLTTWNRVLSSSKGPNVYTPIKASCAYMRSTISSARKCKKNK